MDCRFRSPSPALAAPSPRGAARDVRPIYPLVDPDHQIRGSGAMQAVSVRALRRAIHDQRDAGRSSRGLPHHVARRLVVQAVVGASRRAGRTVRMVPLATLSAPGWVTQISKLALLYSPLVLRGFVIRRHRLREVEEPCGWRAKKEDRVVARQAPEQ